MLLCENKTFEQKASEADFDFRLSSPFLTWNRKLSFTARVAQDFGFDSSDYLPTPKHLLV